jgi:hypothetical protein
MAIDFYSIIEPYIPCLSGLVSLGSLYIAIRSLRNSNKYLKFEYQTRLEVEHEVIQIVAEGKDSQLLTIFPEENANLISEPLGHNVVFSVDADLVNQGEKTIQINEILLDFGSFDDKYKREHYLLEGSFYLSKTKTKHIKKEITKEEIIKAMQKWKIVDCIYFLRINFQSVDGNKLETTRMLGGIRSGQIVNVVHKGNVLT